MDFDWIENTSSELNQKRDSDKKTLSPRDKNEITASMIKKQIGDIEQVRALMGLNKKKMCELLLIDPSTWTRWTTGKTEPPTWVYRTLQWGLAVMDKHPEFHPLLLKQNHTIESSSADKDPRFENDFKQVLNDVNLIKKELKRWVFIAFGSTFLTLLMAAYILIY